MPKTGNDLTQHGSRSSCSTVENNGHSANSRGESLAARIEEGAAGLAAFAEGLPTLNGIRLSQPRTGEPWA